VRYVLEGSEREIMAITGHRSVSEVSQYTKAAEQAKLAEQAMRNLSERTGTKAHTELMNRDSSARVARLRALRRPRPRGCAELRR
jgi:hypothetical protein